MQATFSSTLFSWPTQGTGANNVWYVNKYVECNAPLGRRGQSVGQEQGFLQHRWVRSNEVEGRKWKQCFACAIAGECGVLIKHHFKES
jgi:hypothetical protein